MTVDTIATGNDLSIGGYYPADLLTGWAVSGDISSWREYTPPGSTSPETGMKVHVSASRSSASEVLNRAVPILSEMAVPFKHAKSLDALAALSSGRGGRTQVGKFLTAYPPDTEVAHILAARLDKATRGLQGPRIPFETPYTEGSLVHVRYGSFARRWLQLRTGRIVPARAGTTGCLEVDDRFDNHGSLAHDLNAVSSTLKAPEPRIIRDTYACLQPLHFSPKGTTWLAIPLAPGDDRVFVAKEALAFVMEGSDGLDARDRLRREAASLENLSATGVTPRLQAYWEEERSGWLVYELVAGPTLASIIHELQVAGLRPPADMLIQWATALCAATTSIHRQGVVVGDMKPANLVYVDGGFRIIDLELASEPSTEASGGMGTHGYCSPQQMDPAAGRAYTDDVYAIGATLLAAATTSDAGMLPDLRRVAQLEASRDASDQVFPTILRCLASAPTDRPQSAAEILEDLGRVHADDDVVVASSPSFIELAGTIGDSVLANAIRDGDRAFWRSDHPVVGGVAGRDLYAGSAGTALFLCHLYEATEKHSYLDTALAAGTWLASGRTIPVEDAMPGLFFGEAGVGLLYLTLYRETAATVWLDRAADISDEIVLAQTKSPDLMTGRAGIGIFHLALWRASMWNVALQRAFDDANALLGTRSGGTPTWKIPPAYESLSGGEYLGFAHGAAGIGYFLCEAHQARADTSLADATVEIADYLLESATAAPGARPRYSWPATTGGDARPPSWCHGATGFANFFAKAARVLDRDRYRDAAVAAGRSITSLPWAGTTQCHGLAGSVEALVDMAWLTGDEFAGAVQALGENLATYGNERGWPSENYLVYSDDFMVGQGGVGEAFLRIANPSMPSLLSLERFDNGSNRSTPNPTGGG